MEVNPQFLRNTKSLARTPQGENQGHHIEIGQGHLKNTILEMTDMKTAMIRDMIRGEIKTRDQEVGQIHPQSKEKNIGQGHHIIKEIKVGQGHQM